MNMTAPSLTLLPGSHFGPDLVESVDPAVQALLDEDVEFDLGHVEPTAVLRGIDEFETMPQRFGHELASSDSMSRFAATQCSE